MSKNSIRLLISFVLSLSCAGIAHWWYQSHTIAVDDRGDEPPIARLSEFTNEVQRKPQKRLIWQTLTADETLFSGEQVRTDDSSTAKIEILDSNTTIELEPGSLITLEKSKGKLALDFVQGNLFVKSGSGEESLELKSGGKEINIAGAEVSLGKTAKGEVDLQVVKGQVAGATTTADEFQIVKPAPQAEVHILPDSKETVAWEWKNSFAANSNIQLMIGKNRNQLALFSETQRQDKTLRAALKPGEYYWKLVASNSDTPATKQESRVYRLKVLPKRPPVLAFPEKNALLPLEGAQKQLTFKWVNPGKLNSLVLEIAESKDFKVGYKSFPVKQDSQLMTFTKTGAYFWRVSGYLANDSIPIMSSLQQFELQAKEVVAAPPPPPPDLLWKKGADPENYLYWSTLPELHVEWNAGPRETQSYRVQYAPVQDPDAKSEKTVSSAEFKIAVAKAGRWQIVTEALDKNQKVIARSKEKIVDVQMAPLLPAPSYDPTLPETLVTTGRGKVRVAWLPVAGASGYLLTLLGSEGNIVESKTVSSTEYTFDRLKPGNFSVQVLGIDKAERRGPASSTKAITVPATSNVKAPKLMKVEFE